MAVVPIGTLRNALKTALDANNLAVGAPIHDLSSGMTNRVKRVATLNPADNLLGANEMPAVCIYPLSKSPRNTSIGPNRLETKQEAFITLGIVGMVFNQQFLTDIYDDPATRDLENLMENIEQILRGFPQISGATWTVPNDITYHMVNIDEQTNFKAGIMELQFKFFY